MNIQDIIQQKRDSGVLSPEQIRFAVQGYTNDQIPDYQMASLLMAIYIRGMNEEETVELTRAMLESGQQIEFPDQKPIPMDKHSTGGVGDKITLPLVPLVMAYNVPVPMLSGRGLGYTGGTLDKLESIPGMRVNLSIEEYKKQVQEIGAVIMGQTAELAPADKKIYALRDVTATVPSIPLITASILSKKVAGGAKGLVLDIKCGKGAFMESRDQARTLAKTLLQVGKDLGLSIRGYITNMSEPIGRTVGHALEIRETIEVLRGEGPEDTTELTRVLGGEMLLVAGVADSVDDGRMKIAEAIEDGRGLENLKKLIAAQGGDPSIVDQPNEIPTAPHTKEIGTEETGWVKRIDAQKIARAAFALGAGRKKKEDSIDPAVGIELLKKSGKRIRDNEPIARLHYNDASDLQRAEELVQEAFSTDMIPPQPDPLIWESISDEE